MGIAVSLRCGLRAEQHALAYLQQQGLSCLTQGYRCRWGELDLVMRHDDTLVVVEVKMRRANIRRYGHPVTPAKQRKIICATEAYLAHHPMTYKALRFDVLLLQQQYIVQWLQDAFRPET